MYKRLCAILLALCLLPLAAMAEGAAFTVTPECVRPGKMERISFTVPRAGTAGLYVQDEEGNTAAVIREGFAAAAGENHLTWDGKTADGRNIPAGLYRLLLTDDAGKELASAPLTVGKESPELISLSAPRQVSPGTVWELRVDPNMAGILVCRIRLFDGEWHTFMEEPVPVGESVLYWNGTVDGAGIAPGEYSIQIRLTDAEDGFSGTAQQITLNVLADASDAPQPAVEETPAPAVVSATQPPVEMHTVIPSRAVTPEQETSYWTLPVGEMDEKAIWDVMMQPIVVIEGEQKEVYRLRKTPDNSTKKDNVVGEITYASQGVHVLETLDNGWTLVEAYNSSYGPNCKSRPGYGVTDDLIRGYVKTSLLKTIQPRDDYGLLIDKLEQKMYIFESGKCTGSLLISTGLNNSTQSWNETPSGEFLMVSRMGGFPAGNLWCAYGMRVNGGCAVHEVPYIGNADTDPANRDYSSTVPQLGKKASHGCIRVQRDANEQGQNIKWLWDHIKVNTKVLIWDDTGRYLPYPADDTPIYYNPNNGKYYHENQYCSSVKDRYLPLTAITYAELNTTYDYLTPCSRCGKIMKKAEIDAMNRENGF